MSFTDIDSMTDPIALWPLTKPTKANDILTHKIPTTAGNIGYDPRWAPSSLMGSAIFSGNLMPQESFVEVRSSHVSLLASDSLTIMAWIWPEGSYEMALFDFRGLQFESVDNLYLTLNNGQIQLADPGSNLLFRSLSISLKSCLKT